MFVVSKQRSQPMTAPMSREGTFTKKFDLAEILGVETTNLTFFLDDPLCVGSRMDLITGSNYFDQVRYTGSFSTIVDVSKQGRKST